MRYPIGHLTKILRIQANSINTFVKIAANVNSPHSDHLGTDQYVKVLLNSMFTLALFGITQNAFDRDQSLL